MSINLRTLIGADKSYVKSGDWRQGEIPRPQWPSRRAKSKAYKYGPSYQWRIITFVAMGQECRVKLLLNIQKQIFRASFGLVASGDTKILCDYEFHASEPGWHCHARCGDVDSIDSSTNRFGSKRLPPSNGFQRRTEFVFGKTELSSVTAFNAASEFFKLYKGGGFL